MGNENSGMSATVGARKMDEDGNVTQEEGHIDSGHSYGAWAIFTIMCVLSMLGVWQIIEMLMMAV